MTLAAQVRQRRKDSRFILASLALVLIVLSALYAFLQSSRDLPSFLVANRILLFALQYVNIVLVVAILFVLVRDLARLVIERRHGILGSKFKAKLVATYIGLSLVPALLLFFYASDLIQRSVDRWFATPAREVLRQGSAVAEAMHRTVAATTLRDARRAAATLAGTDLQLPENRPELGRHMEEILAALDLDLLSVYRGLDFVHAVVDPRAGLTELPEPGRRTIEEAEREGEAEQVRELATSRGLLFLSLTALPREGEAAVVVAGRLLDPDVAQQSRGLIQAFQDFRQAELERETLKASHRLLFLMITLLILLASSWVGLHLARRVTLPIQALADGTRRISSGDLAHRVEVEADDELGVLVESFNRMTAELERNKALLEDGNRELRDANRRLADQRALSLAVLESVAAGVVALDPDGKVVLANSAALGMLHQREEEVVGRAVHQAWGDPERAKLLPILDGAGTRGGEVRVVLGGEWKTFEVKRTDMAGDEGPGLGCVLVLEDLTELIKAQKLAAWSEAARRIAHEIKNPLTPIQLAAERMLHRHRHGDREVGEVVEQGVEIIVREVKTLKGMVDEFSRFARMPRPQLAEVDLTALVSATTKLYADLKPGVEVVGRVAAGAERGWVDPDLLRSALVNLIDNALEATDPPGSIEVAATQVDGVLRVTVADTGRGIPPEAKEKLFLPYYSTKGRGTGLGLAIVHRVVSDHHGTIRVEDNTPRGTVFVLDLPLR